MSSLRRASAAVGILVALSLAGCSKITTPPSDRTGTPASALAGRCWPLPAAAHFDFPYQVTGQTLSADHGSWTLRLQWDKLSRAEVTSRLAASFTRAGFGRPAADGDWTRLTSPTYGSIAYRTIPLTGGSPAYVVRGTLLVSLPGEKAADRTALHCPNILTTADPLPAPPTPLTVASKAPKTSGAASGKKTSKTPAAGSPKKTKKTEGAAS